jgi:hypothetical protein
MRRTQLFLASCVSLVLAAQSLHTACAAIINLANLAPVIGGNSDYPSGDFNSGGTFATHGVTDGQNAIPDNHTGTIIEASQDGSFWLGRQGVSTGYWVIDLGAAYRIGEIVLFNTSNGPFGDRGTGDFTVKGSNSITDLGGTLGFDISGTIHTLASGTLVAHTPSAVTPIVPQSFPSLDITAVQYIRFDALSIASIAGPQGTGLNEMRLFLSTVPEPSTLVLLGLGGVGLAVKRRRRGWNRCVRLS